jgi:hypothetical protein
LPSRCLPNNFRLSKVEISRITAQSRFIRLKKEKRQPHAGIAPTIPSPNQLNHSGAPHYGARGAAQRFTQSQRIFCGKRQK